MMEGNFDLRQIPDPQARLDRYMDSMNGEIISPDKVSWLFFGDFIQANDELLRWESRHPKECFRISSNPIQIRVSISVDSKYNHSIHDKHREGRDWR